MPFFKWGKKSAAAVDVNYRAKVENKLSLAKQNPEPVFDLTDCNLHDVPSGVYSWCKVCRKEILLLQNNVIKSLDEGGNIKDLFLLRVLDVHNNKLTKLPTDIGMLTNLQVLHLHFNQLKTLPETLKNLKNLQELNLQGNTFKEFPEPVCHLPRLRDLNISANLLKSLPKSFCKIRTLKTLILDAENYEYPPTDVCLKGLEHIMIFLCNDCGVEYSPLNDDAQEVPNFAVESPEIEDRQRQVHYEARKSLQELLANLSQVSAKAQTQKNKLVEDLIQEQDKVDGQLSTAQSKKEGERKKFVEELLEVEQESMAAIFELLEISEVNQNTEVILLELARERKEFEDLFLSTQRDAVVLRRKEVLMAMENTLENQIREAQAKSSYSADSMDIIAKTQQGDLERDIKLEEVMTKASENKQSMVLSLLKDEEVQKKAFEGLLLRKDEEFVGLTEKILLIENELVNLTLLEVKKRALRMEDEKDMLEEQRELLTKLLIQMMAQQEERRQEFIKRLVELEDRRRDEQTDFWLVQYQRLMDSKPDNLRELEKLMSVEVKNALQRANAKKYVPLFAKCNISIEQLREKSDHDLQEMGVWEEAVREAILREAREDEASLQPAARSQSERTRTAFSERQTSMRARFECECVICMERQCNMLFLNCGHVCCCDQCGSPLKDCPMCRTAIARTVFLDFNSAVPLDS